MNTLFDEMTASLSEAVMKYKNTIKLGGFNIDIKNKGLGYGKIPSATFSTLET